MERLELRALLSVGGHPSSLLEMGRVGESSQSPAVETWGPAPIFHHYGIVGDPIGKVAAGPLSPQRDDSTSLVIFTSSTSTWVILIFPSDSPVASPVHAKRAISSDPLAGVPAKVTAARLKAPVSNKAINTGPSPLLATSLLETSMLGGEADVNPLHEAVTSQLDLATVRSLEVHRSSQHSSASPLEMPAASPRSATLSASIDSVVHFHDIQANTGQPEGNSLSLFARGSIGGDGEGSTRPTEIERVARLAKSGASADIELALEGIGSPDQPGGPVRLYDLRAFDEAIEAWMSRCDDQAQVDRAVRHGSCPLEWLPQDAGLLELPAGDAAYFMPQHKQSDSVAVQRWAPAGDGESELRAEIGLFQAFELASTAGEDTAASSDMLPPSLEAGLEMASPGASPSTPPPAQDRPEDAPERDLKLYFTGAAATLMMGGRLLYGHVLDRTRGADVPQEASQR